MKANSFTSRSDCTRFWIWANGGTSETGLPLPMGGNAIRRDLGPEIIGQVSHWLRESIRYSLANREDALEYAMQFARDMDPELADRFVAMWVNDLTLDYTDRGREAVRRLLTEGFERGIIPNRADRGICRLNEIPPPSFSRCYNP